jgi:hypothetical protein
MMALWNSPQLLGMAMCAETDVAPALSPICAAVATAAHRQVTRAGGQAVATGTHKGDPGWVATETANVGGDPLERQLLVQQPIQPGAGASARPHRATAQEAEHPQAVVERHLTGRLTLPPLQGQRRGRGAEALTSTVCDQPSRVGAPTAEPSFSRSCPEPHWKAPAGMKTTTGNKAGPSSSRR